MFDNMSPKVAYLEACVNSYTSTVICQHVYVNSYVSTVMCHLLHVNGSPLCANSYTPAVMCHHQPSLETMGWFHDAIILYKGTNMDVWHQDCCKQLYVTQEYKEFVN